MGEESGEEVNLVLKPYTGSNNQKWKIALTSHGSYKIKAKSSESVTDKDLVMVVQTNILYSSGLNIQQRQYIDNTSYKDEWRLHSLDMKYINYYDSSLIGNSTTIGYISTANSFSNLVYNNLCGISLSMESSAQYYAGNVIDQCSLSINSQCTSACGINCRYHHKNIINISDQLNGLVRDKDERCVLWTNRTGSAYCYTDGSSHASVSNHALAVVCYHRPAIHFFTIYGNTNNEKKAFMSINLAHETAHTFGFSDVYGTSHDGGSGMQCLMEYYDVSDAYRFYNNIQNGLATPFCSSCVTSIKKFALNSVVDQED